MTDSATILIVDDDPSMLSLSKKSLEESGYNVEEAEDGQQALDMVMDNPDRFDIVLSDVNMPVMDGYQFCQKIKESPDTEDIPVVFISAMTTLEEKLKGYKAGADDYIAKPISVDEVALKVKTLISAREKRRALKNQLTESSGIAMQAMTYSSGLGQILEFYKKGLNSEGFDDLAEHLFEVTRAQGLHCSLQIITPNGVLVYGDNGDVTPLEANVIEMARSKGRFFDFSRRTIINYEDFSLLVKNMPADEPERYGILKDMLATLCDAVEIAVKRLLSNQAEEKRREVMASVKNVMNEVNKTFQDIQYNSENNIRDMLDELDDTLLQLGLTEEQENDVRKTAQDYHARTAVTLDMGAALNGKFDLIQQKLAEVLGVKA